MIYVTCFLKTTEEFDSRTKIKPKTLDSTLKYEAASYQPLPCEHRPGDNPRHPHL